MQSTHANHPSVKMIAAFDRGDWPSVLELVAPNARAYVGSTEADREGWKQFGQMWAAAFPDTKHEIVACHVAGEYATVVCKLRATHKGEFMGLPATGRQIIMDVIHVDRVIEGRIVEHRGQFDSAGLMQQLAPLSKPDVAAFSDELFRRLDARDLDRAFELVADDCKVRIGGQVMDKTGWRGMSAMFNAAFPDGKHTFTQYLLDGDRGTGIGTYTGTHRGDLMGLAPTGRKATCSFIGVMRLSNGKVVELEVEMDVAGLMQQLGVGAPPPDHRAFLVNMFDLIDGKKFAEAREQILPNGRFVMGGQAMDRDGWAAFSQAFFAAFPDGHHVHDQIVTAGDRIIHTGSFEGTHRADFQGIPATNRRVSFTYIGVMTLQNGKILEERVEANFAGLVQQLTA